MLEVVRDNYITSQEDIADPSVAVKVRGLLAVLNAPASILPLDPSALGLQNLCYISADFANLIDLTGKDTIRSIDEERWRTSKRWNLDEVYDTLLECGEDVELTWRSLRNQARDLEREELLNANGYVELTRKRTRGAAAVVAVKAVKAGEDELCDSNSEDDDEDCGQKKKRKYALRKEKVCMAGSKKTVE